MKKKNTLPIKWILGILIILIALVYWMNQSSNNMILRLDTRTFPHKTVFFNSWQI